MDSLQHRLEGVLNRVISDSGALPHLRPLEGRVVAVLVKGLVRTVYFSVHDAQVRLTPAPAGRADVSISGTPGAFTRVVTTGFDPAVFRDGSLTLEGDPETVSDLKTLLGALDPDAEEALARVLGDTLAHKAANGARMLGHWAADAADSGTANVAEFLVEETRLLASRPRVERFIAGVDQLRDDAERLRQRIERLAHSHKARQGKC
jgi:ubiquinone biosynthesis protein UbiJ